MLVGFVVTIIAILILIINSREGDFIAPETQPSSVVASSTSTLPVVSPSATTTVATETRKPFTILIGTTTSKSTAKKGTATTSTPPSKMTTPKNSSVVSPVQTPPLVSVPPKQVLTWGVFAGSNPTTIADFESKIKVNPDYLAYFIHWPNGEGKLPAWIKGVAGTKKRTLVIFWEASDHTIGGTDQPAFSYSRILAGEHDTYIEDFAEQLRVYKDPIILIPFSELNGNWTPWSGTMNGNTPEKAVEAYRYVHGFFDDVPNVKFGLALNASSVPNTPENALTAYYPGDAYVDYVGLDGFNMGDPWHSFNEIFGSGLKTISLYNKPMFIFSFASAEGNEKALWIQDAFDEMKKYPSLKGFIYFNQNKERNWLLWSDKKTQNAFTDFVEKL